jgi:poly(3-hydroxybutyrate) depolymerase
VRVIRIVPAALLAAAVLGAQPTAPGISPERQPDYQALSGAVRTLRRSAAPDVATQVDKLVSEAGPSVARGEARRKLANAWALLKGESWDKKAEFQWSLALRPDAVVADSTLPLMIRLTQLYPATYKGTEPLKLKVSLQREESAVREIGAFDLPANDLIEQPFGVLAKLDGVADGSYTVRAEVLDGGGSVAAIVSPLAVVRGIIRDHAAIEHRLSTIQGHDGVKASIRYPYVLAETVNMGRRHLDGADFGLPFQPQPPYDFAAGVVSANALLKSLEAGKDPLYRAKGDHERHYWFEEAGEMMAYHVYAPMKWDGKSKLPMVLVLHGNTRDQDYYFDRDDHILAKLAEQHGYLVVCPMGYRPSAGWGSNSLNRPPANAAAGAPGGRGGFAADPARMRQGEWSEKDALNVLDLVTKEYPIDPARIYLFGHSAGGAGTWYMGEKYADKWAAIAASAAATRPAGFPFDRLKGMPIMVCHGDKDDEVPVTSSRNMVKAAKDAGLDPQYLEVPGATHLTIVALVEPKVFDFFDQHPHKVAPAATAPAAPAARN